MAAICAKGINWLFFGLDDIRIHNTHGATLRDVFKAYSMVFRELSRMNIIGRLDEVPMSISDYLRV